MFLWVKGTYTNVIYNVLTLVALIVEGRFSP